MSGIIGLILAIIVAIILFNVLEAVIGGSIGLVLIALALFWLFASRRGNGPDRAL